MTGTGTKAAVATAAVTGGLSLAALVAQDTLPAVVTGIVDLVKSYRGPDLASILKVMQDGLDVMSARDPDTLKDAKVCK